MLTCAVSANTKRKQLGIKQQQQSGFSCLSFLDLSYKPSADQVLEIGMGFKQLICLSTKVQQHLKTMEIRNTSEFWQTRAQHTDSHTDE